MSNTMVDYLGEYGDVSFKEQKLNDVDSLLLCQLAYLKFDDLVPGLYDNKPWITLQQLSEHPFFDQLFSDERYEKDNRALFEGMLSGKRFRNLKCNYYMNMIDPKWESQFSAITYQLGDGTVYVAYRGTDESIVGWKEDFNMAFLHPVPGQEYSVKYVTEVLEKKRVPVYIGGHSKGGNLAVYAAMNCGNQIQDKIIHIYSMDGPGFRPEILQKCGYAKIADKVIKIMPHSSLVGMLFEQDENYQVVESKTFGLAQHNPYTWLVENGEFSKVDDIYESRKFLDSTINEWILSLEEQELGLFVDTLYQVISASKAEDLIEFTADWKKSMNAVITAMKEVDDQTKQVLKEIIKSLFSITRVRMIEEFGPKKRKTKKKSKA